MPRCNPECDYTKVPNNYLRDQNLSLKAKGLLTQILSLSEDWNVSIARLAGMNADGQSAIKAAIKELEKHGYLARRQIRDGTKLAAVEYIPFPLVENQPAENHPTENLPAAFPPEENRPSNKELSNKELSNKYSIDKLLSNKSFNHSDEMSDGMIDHAAVIANVNDRIRPEWLMETHQPNLVQSVVDLVVDTISYQHLPMQIDGMVIPAHRIREALSSLNHSMVDEVLSSIKEAAQEVTNMRAYLLTCLYRKATTVGAEDSLTTNRLFG